MSIFQKVQNIKDNNIFKTKLKEMLIEKALIYLFYNLLTFLFL